MICNLNNRRSRGFGLAAIVVALVGPLAGCATTKTPKLAVCDGRHKRPANPFGSILPGAPAVVYVPGKKGVPVAVPAPPRVSGAPAEVFAPPPAPGAPDMAPVPVPSGPDGASPINPAATSALTPGASRRVFASC
ncbi:hypothetical protein GCM10011404_33520 [Sphingomonas prati]|nr:hypothetical protein GCM10011404_33520 [Sphingomonas prati]